MPAICPLCGDSSSQQLSQFCLETAADLFTPQIAADGKYGHMKAVLARLWPENEVRVMRCEPCDFGFADPFTAGPAEFYQLEAPDTPYPVTKWEYQRTLQSLAATSETEARLLDVGAGKGHFLVQLLNQGWAPRQLAATEFSQAGREAIERRGVACLPHDMRDLEQTNAFDVVCMFQVLEHLDGYDALFAAIARLCRPGARLFIAVPNGARIDFNEKAGLQQDCPPNHISRWSPRSFQVLAAKYGWETEQWEFEPEPALWKEAAYAAVNRYIRNSHNPGSWAQVTSTYADRGFTRSGAGNRLIKALGMATSADAWRTALRVAGSSLNGGVPHALWVQLRRQA
jgi:2-polyprenyl-3-methyl-5-hydroxy-6-metoxy-1,4-benzoquinol methylase